MTGSRASDVFVRCLEAEGVRRVFGIPGEETLDLNHSLAHSPVQFVPDGGFGSIAWKQRRRFDGEHFGTSFANPDFVGLAASFGMPAWRCGSASDFGRRLRHALSLDVPSLIVLPVDSSVDVAMSDELGEETVIRT